MIDIILAAIIVLSAIINAKRGFVRSLMGTVSTLLSVVLSMILYRPVSLAIYNSSPGDMLKLKVEGIILEKIKELPLIEIGVDAAVEAGAMLIINVISFVLVIVIAKFAVMLVSRMLNIAAKLPVIKQANSLLGLVIGAVLGILVCYIIMGVVAALCAGGNLNGDGAAALVKDIENSSIAAKFYENNVIENVLTGFMK